MNHPYETKLNGHLKYEQMLQSAEMERQANASSRGAVSLYASVKGWVKRLRMRLDSSSAEGFSTVEPESQAP